MKVNVQGVVEDVTLAFTRFSQVVSCLAIGFSATGPRSREGQFNYSKPRLRARKLARQVL